MRDERCVRWLAWLPHLLCLPRTWRGRCPEGAEGVLEITHEVRGHNGLQLPQARITMSKMDGSYNKRMAALRRLVLKTCNPSGCLGEHRVVHALQVAKYLLCRNACCHDAYALHPIVSMCVVLMLLILMVLSVNLNNQLERDDSRNPQCKARSVLAHGIAGPCADLSGSPRPASARVQRAAPEALWHDAWLRVSGVSTHGMFWHRA